VLPAGLVAGARYWIVQESATNARRYAVHATSVDGGVTGRGVRVRLVVRDDGRSSRIR